MQSIISRVTALVPAESLFAIAIFSLLVFVGSLVAIPFILVRLPVDYFDIRVPRYWMKNRHPALRAVGMVVKNILGVLFMLAGLAMLVLPGQGLLTLLIGISLADFPGKRRLEAGIVGQPAVLSVINALRNKFGRAPLVIYREPD